MARGGRRTGSGGKFGSKPRLALKPVVLDIGSGKRIDAPELPPEIPVQVTENTLVEPPTDIGLSDKAIVIWRRFAPYAIHERTLVQARIPGFARLCEHWVYCAEFRQRIELLGITTEEADRLLKRLNDYSKLLNAALGDFNLRSFGKPAAPEKPKANANPFAKLA